MAKFLTGNNLNAELEKLFESASQKIVLISPYVKLHDRYTSTLLTKKALPNLEIVIVFGKNEEDLSRSMKEEDFNFFKQFPNIQIRYEKRLHAKYYANESYSILSSMNLYSYSQDNNIEAGVLTKSNYFSGLASDVISNVTGAEDLDSQAWNYFERVIDQSELLFERVPKFEKVMLGLSQKYVESVTETDKLSAFFSGKVQKSSERKATEKTSTSVAAQGFCIRTGKRIPFNLSKPLCEEAFENWSKYKNEEFKEKFCHFSGERSDGDTSFARPILRKNYSQAKLQFKLK